MQCRILGLVCLTVGAGLSACGPKDDNAIDPGKRPGMGPAADPPPTDVAEPHDRAAGDDSAIMRRIIETAELPLDGRARDGLMTIAGRRGLSGPAQVLLVEKAVEELTFDVQVMDVLNVLLENPDLHPVALDRMEQVTDRLAFETTREVLAERIAERRAALSTESDEPDQSDPLPAGAKTN